MSFGFSVGDLIAVGTLANQLWTACREASPEFQECGNLCQEVSLVIEGCRPTNPNSILRVQDSKTISQLAQSCGTTLSALETLLQRYNSLGSTTHRIRDTLGFAYAKADCDKIRRRLGEHLLVINTFLTGRQVTAPDSVENVTPELFFALFTLLHNQTLESPAIDSSTTLDLEDETKWQAFRAQVIAKADIEGEYLDQKRSYVKACVRKIAKDQAKVTKSKARADDISTFSETTASPIVDVSACDSVQVRVSAPAKPKGIYNPWAIPWFSAIGIRYLQAVAVGFDYIINEPPCIWRYSKEEEWLCLLPEGWSRTPTMILREGNLNPAYYYSYNNLSCQSNNRPKMSRAYFYYCPFSCDNHTKRTELAGWQLGYDPRTFKPCWWIEDGGIVRTRSIMPSQSRFEMGKADTNPNVVFPQIGFISLQDSLPWDLDDDVSKTLVELLIGPNGTRTTDDYEAIARSLPDEWYCRKLPGSQNILYVNATEAWKSTVHPARFTDPQSEVSHQLPAGWDRRLDSWGNLFFVDHHTKSASREDPRFSRKVDQDTGLPTGWHSIKDRKDREFFFRRQGRMIVGTYNTGTLNSKDLRHKIFIDTEPKSGEEPKISDMGREFLGETESEEMHTTHRPPVEADVINRQAFKAADSSSTVPLTVDPSPMTEDEKAKYYAMFEAANKESKWFINSEEAMEQSHAFGLPPGIAIDIWNKSDANHDQRWNIDEYANAMHEIMIQTGKLEDAIGSQQPGGTPVPTMDTSKRTAPTASGSATLVQHAAALKLS